MANQFRAVGHTIVSSPEVADLVIVNTCAVTGKALSDSRKVIRRAGRLGGKDIIATGCWVSLEPQNVVALPHVVKIVPNEQKEKLVSEVLNLSEHVFDDIPIIRKPLPGRQFRTRAFIKVQDGCDNRCTYCVTHVARGPSHSRPIQDVIVDIKSAIDGGTKEVVLSGVHLGSWGQDSSHKKSLIDLIQAILNKTSISRLRLSSLEPWDLDADFFDLWKEPRMCKQIPLPLQSGSDNILRRMARRTTQESYAALVDLARAVCPEIAITTDMIVGFPGESEADFLQSVQFVKQLGFSDGHVFSYSARPGTPASQYAEQIDSQTKKDRSAILRNVFAKLNVRYREINLGILHQVLWISADRISSNQWRLFGITDNYIRVETTHRSNLWNEISLVRLEEPISKGVKGMIIRERG
ncbi:MAG: MiaB/RimO family radical SAM methylthiotransferase [Anaerolineaceae bacterium]|nr:MiaB/RimO family radical SAM methylthiotransferase [Anaerolineaceae bacterium]